MTLQFIEWLRRHLDRQTFQGGCVWINKEEQTFKILWPRADRSTTEERLGVMYKWWTHKFGNTRLHNQPTAIKGNFRSCLNSKVQSGEIERVQSLNRREDSDDFKAFRFVNNSEAKRKKQERRIDRGPPSPSERGEREALDTLKYEPGEHYADTIIDGERNEVKQGQRDWKILIEAHSKEACIFSLTFDFMEEARESMEKNANTGGYYTPNKMHFHLAGSDPGKRDYTLAKRLPNFRNLQIKHCPVDGNKSKVLREGFQDGSTWSKLFSIGFLFEVDRNFNIYITRLTALRLHYGYHGATDEWVKLESVKKPELYSDTEEGGVKQMIFSYAKFLNRNKVYENWKIDTGNPEIHLIDPTVTLPVGELPKFTDGMTESAFYFKITHLPAKKMHDTLLAKFDPRSMPNVSDDIKKNVEELDRDFDSLSLNFKQQPEQNQPAVYGYPPQGEAAGYINPMYNDPPPYPNQPATNYPACSGGDPMIFHQIIDNRDSSEIPGPSLYGKLDQLVQLTGGHAGHMAGGVVLSHPNPPTNPAAEYEAAMSPGVEDGFVDYNDIYSPISNADTITNMNSPYSNYSGYDEDSHTT